jgi:uncharacterized protein (DUF1697 family)
MAKGESFERHVVLLRAVNVGGRNKIQMAALRELLEGLGYGNVRTHLQSGNAVFAPDGRGPVQTGREIEEALAEELGVTAGVLVRTRLELEGVIAANPLLPVASNPARLLVTFLSDHPDPDALGELVPADFDPDVFAVGDREIYLWCPEGVNATKLGNSFWEKRFGVVATARNWRTVTRLLELAGE